MAALELTSQIHIQGDMEMIRELNINELETINGSGLWRVLTTIVKHKDKIAFGADVAGGLYGGYSFGEAVEEASKDFIASKGCTSYKDPGNGDGGRCDKRLW